MKISSQLENNFDYCSTEILAKIYSLGDLSVFVVN